MNRRTELLALQEDTDLALRALLEDPVMSRDRAALMADRIARAAARGARRVENTLDAILTHEMARTHARTQSALLRLRETAIAAQGHTIERLTDA